MGPVDLLKQAVAAVDEANVPQDLREIAFTKVLELLQGNSDSPQARNVQFIPGKAADLEPKALSQIASKIGIEPDLLDRVFEEGEDGLIFSGDAKALGSTKAKMVQGIVLLILAGRRWSGLDNGLNTSDEIVRAEVDRNSLLDVTNYGKHISALKPYVTITGTGKKAIYKIKHDGLERAKQIAQSLASES
jgi:hypothetical protein